MEQLRYIGLIIEQGKSPMELPPVKESLEEYIIAAIIRKVGIDSKLNGRMCDIPDMIYILKKYHLKLVLAVANTTNFIRYLKHFNIDIEDPAISRIILEEVITHCDNLRQYLFYHPRFENLDDFICKCIKSEYTGVTILINYLNYTQQQRKEVINKAFYKNTYENLEFCLSIASLSPKYAVSFLIKSINPTPNLITLVIEIIKHYTISHIDYTKFIDFLLENIEITKIIHILNSYLAYIPDINKLKNKDMLVKIIPLLEHHVKWIVIITFYPEIENISERMIGDEKKFNYYLFGKLIDTYGIKYGTIMPLKEYILSTKTSPYFANGLACINVCHDELYRIITELKNIHDIMYLLAQWKNPTDIVMNWLMYNCTLEETLMFAYITRKYHICDLILKTDAIWLPFPAFQKRLQYARHSKIMKKQRLHRELITSRIF